MQEQIVYKKVNLMKDGSLAPLFIDVKRRFVLGEWMRCEFHPTSGFAPRSINGTGEDAIGGWHSCPTTDASWIADELSTGQQRVWLECLAKNVVEYKRPQGIWYLSEWIKPLRVIPDEEVKWMQNNKEEYETVRNVG